MGKKIPASEASRNFFYSNWKIVQNPSFIVGGINLFLLYSCSYTWRGVLWAGGCVKILRAKRADNCFIRIEKSSSKSILLIVGNINLSAIYSFFYTWCNHRNRECVKKTCERSEQKFFLFELKNRSKIHLSYSAGSINLFLLYSCSYT